MLRISCKMDSASIAEIEIAESKDSIEENTFQSGMLQCFLKSAFY